MIKYTGTLTGILNRDIEYLPPATQEKTIIPSMEEQQVVPDKEYTGLSKVTVNAINKDVDSNITPNNIKKDVTILGVTGNITELNGEETEITPTTETQIITPSLDKNAITKVTVNPVTNTIDSNINPNNIKNGVEILGVVGNVVELNGEEKTVIPTKENQTILPNAPKNGLTSVRVNAIPDEYIIPNGELEITENGTHDVTQYASVTTNIHEITKYKPQKISFSQFKGTDLTYETANLDTSLLTSMNALFYNCSNLNAIVVDDWNTSNVTNMAAMFESCAKLTTLNLSKWDTSKVTTINNIFASVGKLTILDVNGWNTENVTNMNGAFRNMVKLSEIDLSSWNTPNVTDNSYMFWACGALSKIVINNPNLFIMTNSNMLGMTPIANGTGYVYVPDDMVETYKSATNWSTYADQIKGVSELV